MSDDIQPRRKLDAAALERNKDLAQQAVEGTATRVGRIATIITTAVADVAREIGELVTDGFEMREAAKRAKADSERLDQMAADRLADDEPEALAPPASTVEILDAEIEGESLPDEQSR
ncbi:hypothetical protein HUN08_04580 [Gordonia sp. X0973]|uniref:hypothetical protein n=1 Tax=Gordonia sp. X0973 TaxID=2742602 RepID=UPI000F5464A8|nr:hypothetical protein [Gordonia sp. X0973]QKT06543.1 hypothetical protein HUN08_04580 [Gordonia sp. X0973]